MEQKRVIQLVFIILTFLACGSFACLRRSIFQPPFGFYYSEGSYHVHPPLIITNMDISMTDCTNMEMPWGVGNRKSHLKSGGQCIIPFEELDCHEPKLGAPEAFDYSYIYGKIKSFRFCSWENHPDSSKDLPSTPIKRPYSLYEHPGLEGKLFELGDVEECMDLPDTLDKKVTSIDTHGNCIYLYEGKRCQGEGLKVSQFTEFNFNLSQIRWGGKASSVKACGLVLQGKIAKFKVTSKPEDLRLDYDLQRVLIADPKALVNTKTSPFEMTYFQGKTFNDTFQFGRIQSLNKLTSVDVDEALIVNEDLCFPFSDVSGCAPVFVLKNALRNAYQNTSQDKAFIVERPRKFPFFKKFQVPPCSSLEISSFILVKKNIPIDFTLGIRISGENRGEPMKTVELQRYLPEGMTYLGDFNKFEILAKTEGRIVTTVGIKTDFERKETPLPGCKETQQQKLEATSEEIPSASPVMEEFKDVVGGNMQASNTTGKPDIGPAPGLHEGQVKEDDNDNRLVPERVDMAEIIEKFKIYWIVMGVMLVCAIYIMFCVRRSRDERRRAEFEVFKVGRNVLTIQFLCCPRRH